MNTTPLNQMLRVSTLDKLAALVDFATLIQVARFDCLVGSIDASQRNVARDGIIYDEVIGRLAVHGVTGQTEKIIQACLHYEYEEDIYGEVVNTLRQHLKQWGIEL